MIRTDNPLGIIAGNVAAGGVTVWYGEPGIGKTALMGQIAQALGMEFISLSCALLNYLDLEGFPLQDKTSQGESIITRHWEGVWKEVTQAEGPATLFLLDEITRVPSAQARNALLRVIQERIVGSAPIRSNVAIVATANPVGSDQGVADLGSALGNRVMHLEGDPSVEDWHQWMRKQSHEHALVSAFLTVETSLVHQFPKQQKDRSGAWPSRRSWDNVGKAAASMKKLGLAPSQWVAGYVGEGAARSFAEWIAKLDIPSPDLILADPLRIAVPPRIDMLVACLAGLVRATRSRFTKQAYDACAKYMERVLQGNPDVAVEYITALHEAVDAKAGKIQPVGYVSPPALMLARREQNLMLDKIKTALSKK